MPQNCTHKNGQNGKLGAMCIGGSVGKETACSAGDTGSIPGWGRSLGEGNGGCLAAHVVHWTQGR